MPRAAAAGTSILSTPSPKRPIALQRVSCCNSSAGSFAYVTKIAAASRATARMSSAPVLFDMRISGSTRASAFMAGSSDGNTLSVTAMIGRGISSLQLQRFNSCAAAPQTRPAPSVAGPAAETSDGPASPGQTAGGMEISLLDRAPLQLLLQRMQDLDLFGLEHAAGRGVLAAGGARQHKLHGDGGGNERDNRELFESLAVLDHTLLDAQALTLKGSKQLLDVPALAVPADHGECLLDTLEGVRREQAPADRIAGGRIKFANLNGGKLDLGRRIAIGAGAWSTDADPSKAYGQASRPSTAFARPR